MRFRRVLVAAQIGLSLLLLVGAGLFVRTLHNLRTLDVGFATDHLVSFGINPRLSGYQTDQVFPLYRRVLQTLSSLPGTRAVAGTDDPDLANTDDDGNIVIAGYNEREDEDMQVEMPAITPGYFATMQTPLLAGRDFTDADDMGKPNVAIVNLAIARHFFGTPQNAIGRFLGFDGSRGKRDTEIVGVVGDTRHARVRDDIKRTVYRPRFQLADPSELTFLVRTWQPPRHRAFQYPRRHAATGLQAGAEQSANHGCADCRQPFRRTADCLARGELWRAWPSCWRPSDSTACWPMRPRNARAKSVFAWRWARSAASVMRLVLMRRVVASRNQHRRQPAGVSPACAAVAQPAVSESVPAIRSRSSWELCWSARWLLWPLSSPLAGRLWWIR